MKYMILTVILICFCFVGSQSGLAQTTYSWTQNAGGTQLWSNASNWQGGVVPDPVAGDTISANITHTGGQTYLELGADRTFETWSINMGGFNSKNFRINSGHTITLDGANPTITVGNGALEVRSLVAGTNGLRKSGSSTLLLYNSGNNFSGGVTLAGGTLTVGSNGDLGDINNELRATANSTLQLTSGIYNRTLDINDGVTVTFNEKANIGFSAPVTGLGGISINPAGFGSVTLTFSSTSNTFTGPIVAGNDSVTTFVVNSLADSSNPLTLKLSNKGPTTFKYGTGAIAPLVLNGRQVILSGNNGGDHIIENANTNASNTITIGTDFDIPSTSNRDLILKGVNTGNNWISGVVPDGSNSVTTLKKEQAGTWVLSGVNTYTGPTLVSGGVLKLAADACLPDAGTLTINGGKLELEAGVRERVDNLVLGGTTQSNLTTYGSSLSSAEIQDDTRFAGSGLLFLGIDPPPQGTVIMVK